MRGGSSSRWLLLAADGTVLAQGQTGPLTGHIFSENDLQLERFVGVLEAGSSGPSAERARRRNYRVAPRNGCP